MHCSRIVLAAADVALEADLTLPDTTRGLVVLVRGPGHADDHAALRALSAALVARDLATVRLALATVTGLTLPPIAIATGQSWMDLNYFQFLGHMASLSVWSLLVALLLRHRGLLRPRRVPLLSWESALFVLARWPYVALGVLAATLHGRRRAVTFKVTPKDRSGLESLPVRVVVDAEKCQGHNRCYALAPELFDVDDFGQAVVIGSGEVAPDLIAKAQLAMANCPEFAISIVDGDG